MIIQNSKSKLCIALDNFNTLDDIHARVIELSDFTDCFKVGLGSFTSHGPKIIELILKEEKKIFLDMKFFDIPNTVKEASLKVAKLGVSILNIHAMGGQSMMEAALEGAELGAQQGGFPRPKVIGVTVLTSTNEQELQQAHQFKHSLKRQVLHLAQESKKAGLDGIVCSPTDLLDVYQNFPKSFVTVTPGISGSKGQKGSDQKRVSSPEQAIDEGSHLLVIGRAINGFPLKKDRQTEAAKILELITPHV